MGNVYIIGSVKVDAEKGAAGETESGVLGEAGRGGAAASYAIGGGGGGGNSKDGYKDNETATAANGDDGHLYIQNSSLNTPNLGESTHASEIHIPTNENPMPEAVKTSFKIGDDIIRTTYYGTAIENMDIDVPTASTGYSFDGYWIKDTDIKIYDNNGKFVYTGEYIKNGVSLFAPRIIQLEVRQVANKYTVTFDAQSGIVTLSDKQVTFDSTYGDLPTPTRTGYTFTGWFTAETDGTEVKSTSAVTTASDHTLYAHWTRIKYTIRFDNNDKSGNFTEIEEEYGSNYRLPTQPSRTGYTFSGWWTDAFTGSEITLETTVDVTEDGTLYAHWTANTYNVSFDSKGGSEVAYKDVTFDGEYGELTTPTRIGYAFEGWFITEETEVKSTSVVTTASNHSLYAHWTANTYQVSFDSNGGSAIAPINVTYDGTYETLPDATRYGYNFDGWYTEKNGGTKKEKTARMDITSDMTLYAHWSPKATNFEAYTASGLGGYYFRSFFDSKVAYEMPDKVMAFTAKVDNDYLLLTAIEGNIIPKETPVILRAEESAIFKENDKNYIKLVTSESGESISAENVLLGTDDDMASPNDRCYILSHGSKGLGFYKWPTTKTLEAHKAYIEGGSSSAKALIFRFEDEATGINNEIIDSASDESEPVIYNLSGIRISKPQKGINIINGKKVWVPGDR